MATKVNLTFTSEEYATLRQLVADGVNLAEENMKKAPGGQPKHDAGVWFHRAETLYKSL